MSPTNPSGEGSQLEILIHWINEREEVRLRKERGEPQPWTADPIIAEWRFCNVDRCQDRETKWIYEHITMAHAESPVLWFNLAIARFINWSDTLGRMGYFHTWEPERFVECIHQMQSVGEKVYTGAYMIPAGPAGTEKHHFLADSVFTPLWDQRASAPPSSGTCADWDVFFRRVRCMGDFLRNQIITDLKYTNHIPFNAADWRTFVLGGPGTQRGLSRLLGRPLDMKWDQRAVRSELQKLRETLAKVDSLAWAIPVFHDLNNLSNCMCEFDKYCRVRNGEGKPRARYIPRAA